MTARPLSLTARTLYAELREMGLAMGATENLGDLPGTFVTKGIKGRTYLYHQYRDLDGRLRQRYLGPDDEKTRASILRVRARHTEREADLSRLDELRAAFVGSGATVTPHPTLRVIRAFADAGVFLGALGGAVLVGTHAFNVLANQLGVRWSTHMMTQDIDLAAEPRNDTIDIAVSDLQSSAPEILGQLAMGFIPIPQLDPREPSTSFRIRGQELRVDLLTPLLGKPRGPIFVPAFGSQAQPLRFLDYLIAEPMPAIVVGQRAMALVSVPRPERFAFHKLLVSESRTAAFATKAAKDRLQALQVLEVLIEEAPDGLAEAKTELVARGKSWGDKLARALRKVGKAAPEVQAFVDQLP